MINKLLLTALLLIFSANIFSQVPNYVPTNGLVGYWPFNGNANDESGNGLNGSVIGATLTADRNGNPNSAYNFDFSTVGFGTQTDEVYIPFSPLFNTPSVSISIWVYQRQYVWGGNTNPPFSTIAARFQYGYSNPNGEVWMLNSGTNSCSAFANSPSINLNSWTHIVSTFENGTGKIYINGQLINTQNNVAPLNILGNSGISIGESNQANGYWWPTDGVIDDFALFNRALTQQEITNLYTSSLPPTCSVSASDSTICLGETVSLSVSSSLTSNTSPCVSTGLPINLQSGLVGYWPFCGNANDASGNGNNGTVNGATLTTDRFGNTNNAYSFNGNQYIDITSTNGMNSTNSISMSIWFNWSGPNSWSHQYFYQISPNPNGAITINNDGTLGVNVLNCNCPSDVGISTVINQNTWYHVVLTYDLNLGLMKMYLNGVLIGTTQESIFSYYTTNNPGDRFGCYHFNEYFFSGKLDDAGLWNKVLTQEEIQQLYNQGQNTYLWSNGATTSTTSVSPTATATYSCTVTNNGVSCTDDVTILVDTPPTPTITPSSSTSICAGGNVTLTSSSATGNLWETGETTQSIVVSTVGNYVVTVTNTSGCSALSLNTIVNVNALPTVNAGIDQSVCAGISVTLSGTGADTYSWDNAVTDGVLFTPAANATYTVTGTNTATGCTNTDQVDVTVNALPTINAGIDQTVCVGSTVTLSGTGADTYSWDNAVTDGVLFTPAANTTYTLTGTNTSTGCANTDQVDVTVNALPTVEAGNDQTICNGDNVILNGSGAATYSWDNAVIDGISFVPTATEIYHLQGIDVNGCQGIDSVQVIVNNPSTSTLTETALDSYTLNGQTYTQSGIYSQVIQNAAGCDSTITLNLTLNFTGIDEMNDFAVSIYPNPSRDVLFIHSEIELFSSFELIDNQGRIVLSDKLKGNQTSVNLEAIAPGNYYLKIEERNILVKVVKQ